MSLEARTENGREKKPLVFFGSRAVRRAGGVGVRTRPDVRVKTRGMACFGLLPRGVARSRETKGVAESNRPKMKLNVVDATPLSRRKFAQTLRERHSIPASLGIYSGVWTRDARRESCAFPKLLRELSTSCGETPSARARSSRARGPLSPTRVAPPKDAPLRLRTCGIFEFDFFSSSNGRGLVWDSAFLNMYPVICN